MKAAGAGVVAKDAVDTLGEVLKKKTREIMEVAVKFTEHANRKRVSRDDIRLAIEHLAKARSESSENPE